MLKLFSVEEANRMIPVVSELLGNLQIAVGDTLRLRQDLSALEPYTVEARNTSQEIGFLLGDIHGAKAELDRLGVFVQDVDSGVIDFPSQVGAEVVCLSWEKGQESITHYHRLSKADRLPLPQPSAARAVIA